MRKLLIAALAVVAVLAVASVAVATNVYTVHLGSTTVKGKGTKADPIPTGLKFGFQVEDTTRRSAPRSSSSTRSGPRGSSRTQDEHAEPL